MYVKLTKCTLQREDSVATQVGFTARQWSATGLLWVEAGPVGCYRAQRSSPYLRQRNCSHVIEGGEYTVDSSGIDPEYRSVPGHLPGSKPETHQPGAEAQVKSGGRRV